VGETHGNEGLPSTPALEGPTFHRSTPLGLASLEDSLTAG